MISNVMFCTGKCLYKEYLCLSPETSRVEILCSSILFSYIEIATIHSLI